MQRAGRRGRLHLFVLAMIILNVVVRSIVSVFSKSAILYFDELFYLKLAQNIWGSGQLTVYHQAVSFSKILYSVLLSPFYAIGDPVIRVKAISFLNVLLVSSSLIPGYLLARSVLRSDRFVALSVVLLSVLPETVYCTLFMAENLQIPLLIWGFYFAYRALSEKKWTYASLLGFWCFLLYLNKETGLAFFGSCLAALLVSVVTEKNQRTSWKSIAGFAISFITPFIVVKLTMFRGMDYTYKNQIHDIFSCQTIGYVIWAAFQLFFLFVLSNFLFPVIIPVARNKKMTPGNRFLLLVSILFLVFLSFGTAYGVVLHEADGQFQTEQIRTHLRYFLSAIFPFFLLMFSSVETDPRSTAGHRFTLAAVFLLLAQALVFRIQLVRTVVDSPAFQMLIEFSREKDPYQVLLCGAAVFSLFVIIVWKTTGVRNMLALIVPVMIAVSLYNTTISMDDLIRLQQVGEEIDPGEIREINHVMENTDEKTSIVIQNGYFTHETKVFDTFLDHDYYAISIDDLKRVARESDVPGTIDPKTASFRNILAASFMRELYYQPGHIDYILDCTGQIAFSTDSCEDITPSNVTCARLYRVISPDSIRIDSFAAQYVPGTSISFEKENLPASRHMTYGFSVFENGYTWSLGKESCLSFRIDRDEPCDLKIDWCWAMTLGTQRCEIYANDRVAFDGTLPEDERHLEFSVPAEAFRQNGEMNLRFVFPDAHIPNENDQRELAVAFKSIQINAGKSAK